MNLQENHAFWRSDQNDPRDYLKVTDKRSDVLVEAVRTLRLPDPGILEIGCNVGRNLEALRKAGYHDLTGIEISEKALIELHRAYPLLAKEAVLLNFPVEDIIAGIAMYSFDLVFSMAALMHLHPDSEWVFEHIARITKTYLITIEHETYRSSPPMDRLWNPRNYQEIFERYHMKQVRWGRLGRICTHNKTMDPYILRVFEKLAPTTSLFARVPSDMRAMRAALKKWTRPAPTALYIGPGDGDDFFSWLTVGMGVCPELKWTAIEIDPIAATRLAKFTSVPCLQGDYRDGLPQPHYDFIVANHIWSHSERTNLLGMTKLLRARPAMLIARDHKLSPRFLRRLLRNTSYHVYDHAGKPDPHASSGWPPIFIDSSTLPGVYPDQHVKLTLVA